jgi:hypothetical protein
MTHNYWKTTSAAAAKKGHNMLYDKKPSGMVVGHYWLSIEPPPPSIYNFAIALLNIMRGPGSLFIKIIYGKLLPFLKILLSIFLIHESCN